jgi:hypothetical protein
MAVTSTKSSVKRGGKLKKVPVRKPVAKSYLPIRIDSELLERIDAIRPDMVAREPFVRHVLDIGLKRLERRG